VLGPHDVGHRVVVRRIVEIRDDRPVYSDTLGELIEVTSEDVAVRTATGLRRVRTAEITRARRVPDKRRLTGTEALELTAAAGWPAPDLGHLGDWLLRAAGGWTRRGNSALPVGDPDRPLPAAISAVVDWYHERGLPPAISVPLPLRRQLATRLEERGWRPDPPVLVQTAPLAGLLAAQPRPDLPAVVLDAEPSPAWFAAVAARKGPLPDAAHRILRAAPVSRSGGTEAAAAADGVQVRFANVYGDGDAPIAVARGVVTGGWLGLSLMEVAVGHRRRGLAGHVVRALARWASATGAGEAYLQVEQANTAALACYERLGFGTHHTYVAWAEGPAAGC
jgi:RimJ/RimL family protein N-acetyltransferase